MSKHNNRGQQGTVIVADDAGQHTATGPVVSQPVVTETMQPAPETTTPQATGADVMDAALGVGGIPSDVVSEIKAAAKQLADALASGDVAALVAASSAVMVANDKGRLAQHAALVAKRDALAKQLAEISAQLGVATPSTSKGSKGKGRKSGMVGGDDGWGTRAGTQLAAINQAIVGAGAAGITMPALETACDLPADRSNHCGRLVGAGHVSVSGSGRDGKRWTVTPAGLLAYTGPKTS